MSTPTFVLTLDLTGHEHPENPVAGRQFVQQMLAQAAQQIGSGYVDPRIKDDNFPEVDRNHSSSRHARGDIVYRGAAFKEKKIGSWAFLDGEETAK